MKELLTLFLTFAKVGVMTFGGGYAMLPILQREIVENRHWATDEELTDYFAIGQCTPGVIAVNTATFIGQKQKGIPGGIAATLGVVFPSLIIISLLAGVIDAFSHLMWVQHAFAGIRVCVCVLIFNAVLKRELNTVIENWYPVGNTKDLFEAAVRQSRAELSEGAYENLYKKFVKSLRLNIDKNGNICIVVED